MIKATIHLTNDNTFPSTTFQCPYCHKDNCFFSTMRPVCGHCFAMLNVDVSSLKKDQKKRVEYYESAGRGCLC